MPTALIWGATGGIGRALTDLMLEQEWRVVALARRPEQLADLPVIPIAVDVAQPAWVERAAYAIAQEIETADLSVYAAGDIVQRPVEQLRPDDWQRILDANLTGAYLTARAAVPLLGPRAPMVFLGAVSERLRLPGLSAYVAAKAGLEAFVTAFAKEQRGRPITIVRPGAVDTPFWDKVALRKPSVIATPQQVAARIWQAVQEGHSGALDLVH